MNQENLFGEVFEVSQKVTAEQIAQVFDHWVKCHHTRGPRPKLSPLRERRIRAALKEYGTETTLRAIEGCLNSDWHMGKNPSGQKYNDISLILRDSQRIEKFAALAEQDDAVGEFLRDWE